ncbi:MAG: hypothetical protein WED13_08680, partial [Methyloceanibacter sp.]
LMDLINGRTGADDQDSPSQDQDTRSPEASALFAPARFDMSGSQDTLNPEDREEAWSGPAGT